MRQNRNVTFVLVCLIAFAISCEKVSESEILVEHCVSSKTDAIHVSMEGSFNQTKVTVNGSSGVASWTSGDQIAYCVTNGSATQYNIATVDVANSNILPDIASGYSRANYAIYPAASRGTNYTTPTVVYPTSYDLSGKPAETYSPVPMVATNTGSSLTFYHVGGLLRMHLTEVDASATKVTVQFNGMTDVTGTYTVSNPGTTSASTTVSTGGVI